MKLWSLKKSDEVKGRGTEAGFAKGKRIGLVDIGQWLAFFLPGGKVEPREKNSFKNLICECSKSIFSNKKKKSLRS